MAALLSFPVTSFEGTCTVPGDKSISHRALMLSSQALGNTRITGLLEGGDVLRTAAALRALGVSVVRVENGVWEVQGVGTGGLSAPTEVLHMGNAGTAARLMMGLLTPYDFTSLYDGDASLRKRPMGRVIRPLEKIGARFAAQEGGRMPLAMTGTSQPLPIRYLLPEPSAQVKSAILLAGLHTPGAMCVIEKESTRDHTERMLRFLGADIQEEAVEEGRAITLIGEPELLARPITVPADPSSAAFLVVAGLLAPQGSVTITNICMNPARIGLFTTLQEMGGTITIEHLREQAGEPVADIRVEASRLKGVRVPAARAASMIDEYPILAIAASVAEGKTQMEGLGELRVKESDRLQVIAAGLAANGVTLEAGEDWLTVQGGVIPGGGTVVTHMDHRIAMSFLVMGMAAKQPVAIDDGSFIATSFPGFTALMNRLGARIMPAEGAASSA